MNEQEGSRFFEELIRFFVEEDPEDVHAEGGYRMGR